MAAPPAAPASPAAPPATPAPPVPATAPAAPAAAAELAPRLTWAQRGAVSVADPAQLEAALAEIRLARAGLFDETDRLEATL
ncbi:MAG: hypothetical protein H6Q36_1185, partial [Chloroflexi bacterium]|nr:hypothetical protein [Chloroflexota bacterium]